MYIFERVAELKKSHEHMTITRPDKQLKENDDETWNRWLREVKSRLLQDHDHGERAAELARTILDAIEGIQQPNAAGKTAVPITFQAALLQNARGVLGVKRPPNFSLIIDSLYSLGGNGTGDTASQLWHKANQHFSPDGTLATLNSTIQHGLKPYPDDDDASSSSPQTDILPLTPAWFHQAKASSPFHWFHDTWKKLTSDDWRHALPTRRWCDWATCVLRTAIGACYLWEATFYRELANGLLDSSLEPETVKRKMFSLSSPMLTWKHRGPVSTRDVASHIRSTTRIGLNAMRFLKNDMITKCNHLAELDSDTPSSFVDWITQCRSVLNDRDNELQSGLEKALREPFVRRHQNTLETITYSLLCRAPLGIHADHYGMLAKRGPRFSIVEPSPEWPVVIASLACPSPGVPTRLGDVRRKLRQLGLTPSHATLIYTLESAGMCQSSHDADDAIEVNPGF
tara:strand:+ start:5852 stop:7219 length:1368 start_codon:yes stop_codon:yes gene_type:complete